MAATGRYITQTDCERRMSARVVVAIFCDSGDGSLSTEEEDAFEDHILDAESEVEQVVSKTYGKPGLEWLQALGTSAPRSVKRMCLDLFEVRAIKRHPEYIRGDWQTREVQVQADLKALRLRELELESVAEPEAQNEGGEVRSGDPLYPTPLPKVFLDGMGDF